VVAYVKVAGSKINAAHQGLVKICVVDVEGVPVPLEDVELMCVVSSLGRLVDSRDGGNQPAGDGEIAAPIPGSETNHIAVLVSAARTVAVKR
jgi:hypothetical protein